MYTYKTDSSSLASLSWRPGACDLHLKQALSKLPAFFLSGKSRRVGHLRAQQPRRRAKSTGRSPRDDSHTKVRIYMYVRAVRLRSIDLIAYAEWAVVLAAV